MVVGEGSRGRERNCNDESRRRRRSTEKKKKEAEEEEEEKEKLRRPKRLNKSRMSTDIFFFGEGGGVPE